jgi:hypothetical protein
MNIAQMSLSALIASGICFAEKPLPAPELEPLHVVKIAQSGDFMPGPGARMTPTTTLKVNVQSNGCTEGKDFEVKVDKDGARELVSLVRTREDNCKRGARWATVEIETNALSLSLRTMTSKSNLWFQSNPIVISNPLPVEDNTTH